MDRRDFIKAVFATGLAATMKIDTAEAETQISDFPKRRLGNTSEMLSIIGMGGIVVMKTEQAEADRIVGKAVEKGINYFDVAPSYGDAEERMGPALKPFRKNVFLACKTAKRNKTEAAKELHRSLKRLRTDHFDLYQLHALVTMEELDQALGKGGAIELFQKAKEAGLTRYIGFSAHSVEVALAAMDRYPFDTILFPFNWACWFEGDFGPQVLKVANEKKMGVLALKAMAQTVWSEGEERFCPKCWYKPSLDKEEAALGLRFTLSENVTAAIPPGDEKMFFTAVDIAANFKPITQEERDILRKRAAQIEPIFRRELKTG